MIDIPFISVKEEINCYFGESGEYNFKNKQDK